MTEVRPAAASDEGKNPAIAVYALYLACVGTGPIGPLIGVVLAYASRANASVWVRTHFDLQVRLFWRFLGFAAVLLLFTVISLFMVLVLIGIPMLLIAKVLWVVLVIWFLLRSLFGLIGVLQGRTAD